MNYVRTKNKIYRVQKGFEDFINKPVANMCFYVDEKTKEKEWCDAYYIGQGWIRVRDFIAQADTIEELCDEFIVDHKNGTRVIQSKDYPFKAPARKEYVDYLKRNNQAFYGAIWTDKGLIYVAKMNEKGELVLL